MKRWTRKRRQTLAQLVDDVFIFATLSDPARKNSLAARKKELCGPADFVEAEALLYDDRDSLALVSHEDELEKYFFDVKPQDVPRFDTSACKFEGEILSFHRFRQVSLKTARGHRLWSPHVGQLFECDVDIESGVHHGRKRLVNKRGEKWVEIGQVTEFDWFVSKKADVAGNWLGCEDEDKDQTSNTCQMLLGIEFTRDVQWRVVIKSGCGPSLSFATNSVGAMAAFRHREVNSETGRRDALRNWVKQHYRRRANSEDEAQTIKVRRHLRGRTPFRWLGFDCELVVSPWDLRLNERLRNSIENLLCPSATISR